MDQKIIDVLETEEIIKESKFRYGTAYLSSNYLIWKKIKKVEDFIIPLKLICDVKQKVESGLGVGLAIIFGEKCAEEKFIPTSNRGVFQTVNDDEIRDWIINLEYTRSQFTPVIFSNVVCINTVKTSPEKWAGKLTITNDSIIFKKNDESHDKDVSKIEIGIDRIYHVAVQTENEISRMTTFLVGAFWSILFQNTKEFVLVEYTDILDIKQTLLFSFSNYLGINKNILATRIIQEHMKRNRLHKKTNSTETAKLAENPLKIIKIRLAKGEISKSEYQELKRILEKCD